MSSTSGQQPVFMYASASDRAAARRHFEALQNACCAICGGGLTQGLSYCLDHCHRTGVIRGLLCGCCNNGLGQFKDDVALLEQAASYLRRFT